MKQRASLAIVTLILESAAREGSITKTKMMRDVMLSYPRMNKYCSTLVDKGLLHHDPASRRYSITPKGAAILRACNELSGYLSPVSGMIERYRTYITLEC